MICINAPARHIADSSAVLVARTLLLRSVVGRGHMICETRWPTTAPRLFGEAHRAAQDMLVIKLLIACTFVSLAACTGTQTTEGPIIVGMVSSSRAQELEVRCDAFRRDPLGVWFANEQITMNTRNGMMDIYPGRVSLPVAEVLNARCR